jgi:hypothetical protein
MVTGIVIPHETRLEVFIHEFTDLSSYQAAVGGYIEPITVQHPRMTLFANEEGKVQNLPVNRRATWLWWLLSPEARGNDILVGDVALVGSRGGSGSTTDLSPDFIELLLETVRYEVEVRTVAEPKKWYGSHALFDTYFEAAIYGINLADRWTQVCDIRVVAAS